MIGGLTHQEAECIRFIRRFIAANEGVSPSFEEIGAALGLASKSMVARLIRQLKAKGRIASSNSARSIILIGDFEPYRTDSLTALPTVTLRDIFATVETELACRARAQPDPGA